MRSFDAAKADVIDFDPGLERTAVRYGTEWVLPQRFTTTLFDRGFPPKVQVRVAVEVHRGKPVCSSLAVEGITLRDGTPEPVTGAVLRAVPVDRVLRRAVLDAAMPLVEDAGGNLSYRLGKTPRERERLRAQTKRPERQTARWKLTDDHLREVADVYRSAPAGEPVQWVADEFGKPRNTARNWVAEARRRGLLEPAQRNNAEKGRTAR